MMREFGKVLINDQVAKDIWLMRLELPRVAALVRPAQFVSVRPRDGWDPLLRRPLSVLRANRSDGWVELLLDEVGPGTSMLASRCPGDTVDTLGPLGQAYTPARDAGRVILLAGGVGIVPLAFWANEERERDAVLLFGAATRSRLPDLGRLVPPELTVEIATEDGSAGHQGFVTELMEPHIRSGGCQVFCCGPTRMMAAAARIAARFKVPCNVSLENHMACGFGACVGCVVKQSGESDPYRRYLRVCVDGPVFDAARITLTDG